jgi:hypothetical protein
VQLNQILHLPALAIDVFVKIFRSAFERGDDITDVNLLAHASCKLEAAIDKALSSAFGYGTPAYLRYNQAATLEPDPIVANATLRSPVLRPVGGPPRADAKAHEVSRNFSENKERSIALLRKAISTLEEEIADAGAVVEPAKQSMATPLIEATPESSTPPLRPRRWGGLARWWRGRD